MDNATGHDEAESQAYCDGYLPVQSFTTQALPPRNVVQQSVQKLPDSKGAAGDQIPLSAVAGAAVGAIFAPGLGAIIGASVGAIIAKMIGENALDEKDKSSK